MIPAFDWILQLGTRRFGFSHQIVWIDRAPYLERWILWVGVGTLRLHKFWKGDDDRAHHDHPFAFVTIPLNYGYHESVQIAGNFPPMFYVGDRYVPRLRPSFRSALHRHMVRMPSGARPLWTFVITGVKTREWGFWPDAWTFVHWRDWDRYQRGEMPDQLKAKYGPVVRAQRAYRGILRREIAECRKYDDQ